MNPTPDEATIDAVAALILANDPSECDVLRKRDAERMARALAQAGWLKDPGDRVLTGKMAASLHRIGSKHGLDNIDPDHDFTNDDLLTIARSGADYRFRRTDDGARRVAAGGTEAGS